jgi:hypothetical protein
MSDLLAQIRRGEIGHIADRAADGGVLIVKADYGEEAITAARLALGQMPAAARMAAVDVARCESTRAFVLAMARATVGLYMGDAVWMGLPPESRPRSAQDGLVQLGDQFGGTLVRALSSPHEPADEELEIVFSQAVDAMVTLAATGVVTALALFSADELVAPARRVRRRPLENVDRLLWTLRARLQHVIQPPALVLAGGEATGDLTASKEAAFFGWGTTLALETPPALVRGLVRFFTAQAIDGDRARHWAQDIDGMVDGSVLIASRLAELTILESSANTHHETAANRAWTRLMELSAGQLRQTVRALRSVDRLALPVAIAIANGRPPYGVDRHASGPNRALRGLRSAGFVVQHKPREWRLTDPLLAAWLRAKPVEGRYQLGHPTIYVLRRGERSFDVTDGPSLARLRNTHSSIGDAEREARELARAVPGASVQVVDSEDPEDLPAWAKPGDDLIF